LVSGETVVDVDALGRHAERRERVALGGEVLGVGGDARAPHQAPRTVSQHTPLSASCCDHRENPRFRYATVSERDE
jgi:hypothetical protein